MKVLLVTGRLASEQVRRSACGTDVLVLDVDFHVETLKSVDDKSLYTNIYTLRLPGRVNYTDIITKLSESAFIHTVRTRSI